MIIMPLHGPFLDMVMRHLRYLIGRALGHKSLAPKFEPRCGHI